MTDSVDTEVEALVVLDGVVEIVVPTSSPPPHAQHASFALSVVFKSPLTVPIAAQAPLTSNIEQLTPATEVPCDPYHVNPDSGSLRSIHSKLDVLVVAMMIVVGVVSGQNESYPSQQKLSLSSRVPSVHTER